MAFGCALGVLAGLLAVAFESDFPGQICEYNQATKHEDCATYSLVPFLLIKVFNTLNYHGVAITALATVAIGIFTLTLKLSTDRLWVAGEKQRQLYEDTAKRQLRAYLSIELAIRDGGHQLVPEFKSKLIVKNCGQTPAFDGTLWISIYASPQDSSIPPALEGKTITFEMPPGNTITLLPKIDSNKLLFSDEAIDGLEKGKVAIYVLGRAEFKDAFDEKRWFNFRLGYDQKCFASGNLNIEEIKSN